MVVCSDEMQLPFSVAIEQCKPDVCLIKTLQSYLPSRHAQLAACLLATLGGSWALGNGLVPMADSDHQRQQVSHSGDAWLHCITKVDGHPVHACPSVWGEFLSCQYSISTEHLPFPFPWLLERSSIKKRGASTYITSPLEREARPLSPWGIIHATLAPAARLGNHSQVA